ncbi:hypothetical protein FC093_20270 [Ilyomonas limi]|uniref:Exonuclease domain-containing protein n=1 Tax=Ilyomonas limi TaxID=2575867 RepID=A0A4U3KSJ9_9BACT|nr:exonuclease domain-containing protein [Ilyomonas limi]TKK65445.1 hypothetical protein FC093_20270 [Ilyomonas limi]
MEYQYYADKYYDFGLKPTCLSYLKTKFNISEQNPEKAPCHSWRRWQVKRPLKEEINNLPWNFANGVGTVLGLFHRCIDIDNCNDDNILKDALIVLGLPENYEWAVKTPNGYHIHLWADYTLPFITNKELNEGVLSLNPNLEYKNKLSRIELRWANHAVLPPTKLNGKSYHFMFVDFPSKGPSYISLYNTFRYITKFCGSYERYSDCEIGTYQLKKLLFECTSNSQSYNPDLVIYDASSEEKQILYEGTGVRSYSESAPLFIDIETNGLIKDYLDYNSYPNIIQISYCFGLSSEITSHYIKHDNISLSKEIQSLTGITEENLLKEGVDFNYALLMLTSSRRNENIPIVCHNTDFDIGVLDIEHLRMVGRLSKKYNSYRSENPFRNGCQIYCTMKKFSQLFGGKYPKLYEMYEQLFKEDAPKNLHNAKIDVEILRDCFYLMNLYGYIKFDEHKGLIENA